MPDNAKPAILLTRPRAQSEAFAAKLRQALPAPLPRIVISPLLEIRDLDASLPLEGVGLILLTSANGARALARATSRRDIPCLCVGERTTHTARDLGFRAETGGATADDLLTTLLADPPEETVLHARGRHVARDIAGEAADRGVTVRQAVLYDQVERPLSPEARSLLAAGRPVLAPLFSPRTARLFARQAAETGAAHVTALCLSPRVADALGDLPLAGVRIAAGPTAAALLREIAASL